MAQSSLIAVRDLDVGLILSPERYDPRRLHGTQSTGTPVSSIATLVSEQVRPDNPDAERRLLVLDTSDAREGIVLTTKLPIAVGQLGSSKKLTRPGDVIISRLRPYLRQVAVVDAALADGGIEVACSTEFYVLRGVDGADIAFLAAWLLSPDVQQILGVSQEGGHHPRFNASTLRTLRVPASIVAERDVLSHAVREAAAQARGAEQSMRTLIATCRDLALGEAPS